MEDLLKIIKKKYGNNVEIVIAGISRGAEIAELSGILFDDDFAVISIGGGGRYEYLLSKYSLSKKDNLESNRFLLNHFLLSGDIFRLLNRKNRITHVSLGILDSGTWGDSGQTKFEMMKNVYKKIEKKEIFLYQFFEGGHESNPLDEINAYKLLKKNQTNF